MDKRPLVAIPQTPAGARSVRLVSGFLWGAATSSHQVEGGNRWNDWWELEESARLPHRSADACQHYERYESDFDLVRSMGHNAHRLSIEWSRIEPRPGEWNEAALDHYAAVIAALRRRNIEPVVTLHHFTNPAWFGRRGGWSRADSVGLFCRYVDIVAARLAKQVRFWLTINEPTVYVKHAYLSCDWPPCGKPSWLQAARALRHLCRAHTAAYRVLHGRRADVQVGFAHNAPHVVPCDPRRRADRAAAWLRDTVLNGLVFRLFGAPPDTVLDFIGINYYARQIVRWTPAPGAALVFGTECTDDHHGSTRQFSSMGWEIFAPGLQKVLANFARFGVPLMVTENGVATDDEALRCRFLREHLDALTNAVRENVPVIGYFYWTLMDNYEWTSGRTARFGLAEVDFSTQQRTRRPAAQLFKDLLETAARE